MCEYHVEYCRVHCANAHHATRSQFIRVRSNATWKIREDARDFCRSSRVVDEITESRDTPSLFIR